MIQQSDCEHSVIESMDDGFRCSECTMPVVLHTKTGRVVTPAELERWATEAEQGTHVNPRKGRTL